MLCRRSVGKGVGQQRLRAILVGRKVRLWLRVRAQRRASTFFYIWEKILRLLEVCLENEARTSRSPRGGGKH
jgi:hypothetical protein